MRFMQKRFTMNPPDKEYWQNKGWLEHKRPW